MHDPREFKIPQGPEREKLPLPPISIPLEALQKIADFVYILARQDEENDGTWFHRCQSSSIILEHVLKQIDSSAKMVLLDFTWDYKSVTGRLICNNVHYVVGLDGVFLDSCPNMYFHQNRGIEQGLILTPQNTHDGLYERYRDAEGLALQKQDWGGLSVAEVKEQYRGAGILINRYQREISNFTDAVKADLITK